MTEQKAPADPVEVVRDFLAATVDPTRSPADLYAEQVAIEMPLGAPLFPLRRDTTRDELRAGFAAGDARRVYTGLRGVVLHRTDDPEVVIVEYELLGRTLPSERPFALPYIMVVTVRGGRIVSSRDYGSAILGAAAFGMTDQLIGALQSDPTP
jgi:uncharacterized protein